MGEEKRMEQMILRGDYMAQIVNAAVGWYASLFNSVELAHESEDSGIEPTSESIAEYAENNPEFAMRAQMTRKATENTDPRVLGDALTEVLPIVFGGGGSLSDLDDLSDLDEDGEECEACRVASEEASKAFSARDVTLEDFLDANSSDEDEGPREV